MSIRSTRMGLRLVVVPIVVAVLVAPSCSSGGAGEPSGQSNRAPVVDVSGTTPEASDAASTTSAAGTAVTDSSGTEPPATETVATEPTATEPAATEPAAYDFSAVDPIVSEFVEERGLNGAGLVVVDENDGIIHEAYWGEFGPDRISLIASSTKMITASILMRLADDGLLDMDAPVSAIAEWGSGNPDITPAQLVSNSSGLVGLLPNPAYGPYVCQFLPTGTLQECAASIFTTPDDDGDVVAPDSEFRYGGAQWQVAGGVAEIASGRPWSELVDDFVVGPCGVDSLAYNNHFTQIGTAGFEYPVGFDGDPAALAPTDNPNMEAGAYITAPDYARLLLMQLRGGMCDGGRVLSEEAVDRMHTDRIAGAYGGSAGESTGYGMGWWVDRVTGRLNDGGAYGTVPWLEVDDGYGAYLVIEADSGTGYELASRLFDPVADAVGAG